MTLFSTRTRRFVAVGAFALAGGAAVIAPAVVAASNPASTPGSGITAAPACLAWFGNKEDGKCLSYSNGTPANVGTPWVGVGQNGVVTGPLLPGTTISRGIG
ncbi:hypothetical protein ABQF34_21080 [Mycolicibacterium boenickei]